ncbi:MAG TPA: ATP-binding cassette domain-containing protein, partial [Dehalococcoidia bacterium]|nr:ATP-binding cassette domain-containing protein [Dehalococcoidia bacterium]
MCLIGRNGAGKSTTLKLVTGELEPDEGTVERPSSLRFSVLDQKLADGSDVTVREFVARGMEAHLARIAAYQRLAAERQPDAATLREMESLEREILAGGGWSVDAQIDAAVSDLHLQPEQRLSELSGGWRRRVALAQALVSKPELLILDEPTNHLDITTIEWLERVVTRYEGAV